MNRCNPHTQNLSRVLNNLKEYKRVLRPKCLSITAIDFLGGRRDNQGSTHLLSIEYGQGSELSTMGDPALTDLTVWWEDKTLRSITTLGPQEYHWRGEMKCHQSSTWDRSKRI